MCAVENAIWDTHGKNLQTVDDTRHLQTRKGGVWKDLAEGRLEEGTCTPEKRR